MLFLYWAIAIIVAAIIWRLLKSGAIIDFIVTRLFPKHYWEPPVDPYLHDEYDFYD